MRSAYRFLSAALWLAVGFAGGIAQGSAQGIVSVDDRPASVWALVCSARPHVCVLRHKAANLHSGGLSVALEVHGRGSALVPVVVVEGLSAQAALTASLTGRFSVGLRFDRGRWVEMTCDGMIVCAPQAADLSAVATALPLAHAMTLRIDLTVPGVKAMPQPERTFDLSGTLPALAALRRSGPLQEEMPAEPGLDLPELMNRLMGGG